MHTTLLPVILHYDMSAYALSVAFYEALGVRAHIFSVTGRVPAGLPAVVHTVTAKDASVAAALVAFAERHSGALRLLIPCGDAGMAQLMRLRAHLSPFFRMLLPSAQVVAQLTDPHALRAQLATVGLRMSDGEVRPMRRALFAVLCDRNGCPRQGVLAEALTDGVSVESATAFLTAPTDAVCERLTAVCRRLAYRGPISFELVYTEEQAFVRAVHPRLPMCADLLRAVAMNPAAFYMTELTEGVSAQRWMYPRLFWRRVGDRAVARLRTAQAKEAKDLRLSGYACSPFCFSLGRTARRPQLLALLRRVFFAVTEQRLKKGNFSSCLDKRQGI